MEKKQYAVEMDLDGVDIPHLPPYAYDRDLFRVTGESDKDRFAGDLHEDVQLIDATEIEARHWTDAHAVLRVRMAAIEAEVLRAREAWEKAVQQAVEARKSVWENYAPVQAEIERRMEDVMEQRDQELNRRTQAAQDDKNRRLAEEDAALGLREYLVTRPRLRGQESPQMDVPTIHLVGCPNTKRMNRLPEPVRLGPAFEALMDGGAVFGKPHWSWEALPGEKRLFGEVCSRCGVEDRFLAAFPDTYLDWRARAESVTKPVPRDTWTATNKFFADLGLARALRDKEGYLRASEMESAFRKKGTIGQHEGLLCWSDGKYRRANAEKTQELIKCLERKGMTGRTLEGDDSLIVFRFLTKGELRAKAEKVTA